MKIITTLLLCSLTLLYARAQPLPSYSQTTTFGNIQVLVDSENEPGDAGSMNFMGGGGGGFGDSKIFSDYDSQGNMCSAGVFLNSVDFDPGIGVASYTAAGNDGFIQKLSPDGNLLWIKVFTGPSGFGVTDVAIDENDNVYASVYFSGTADFDPGIGVTSIVSTGSFNNSALVKLDANGELVWAKHFANTNNELSGTICLDPNTGDIYVTGAFSGTSDFDPGAGVVSVASGGSWDGYMVHLNSSGEYMMHYRVGVTGYDTIVQVILDNDGNLYMLGTFAGVVDFDFSDGVYTLTSGLGQANTFITKYTADGALIWANMLGGAFTGGIRMCRDEDNNVYYASTMSTGIVDVDPGPGNVPYENLNGGSLVVKLTQDGTYLSHAGLLGGPHQIAGLKLYNSAGLYVQGYFNGTVDFNPGTGIDEFTASANQEFILILNTDLEYSNVYTRPNTWPTAMQIDGVKMIVTGVFTGSVDFDPTVGNDIQAAGDLYGFYISEFSLCLTPTFGAVDVSSCGDYTSPSGAVYTTSGIYTDTIPNAIGCDSILTITLTRIAPLEPTVTISSESYSVCQGDVVTVTPVPLNGGVSPTYAWYVNGNYYNNDQSLTTVTLANWDEVYVVMTSSESCTTQETVTSNTVVFTVGNPGGSASVFVAASPSTILCSNDTVTFTLTTFNPGNNPIYNWFRNGLPTGTNSTELVITDPADGDEITCTLLSSDVCLLSSESTSEPVILNVTQSAIPQVTIFGPGEICPGAEAIFEAQTTGEGGNPMLNWYLNGSEDPIATGYQFSSDGLEDGDVIICVLINNEFCADPVFDVSEEIIANVYSGGEPLVEVSPSVTSVCAGSEVSFLATSSGGGSAPAMQWYINGMAESGENLDTFATSNLNDGDEITFGLVSSLACVTSEEVLSDPIAIVVHPEIAIEQAFVVCPGETIVVGNSVYTEPGVYTDVFQTLFGCDSTITTTLEFFETPDMGILVNGSVLTVNQMNAQYQWLDCSNELVPVPNATNQSFSPSITGNYAVMVTLNGCNTVSECMQITISGVEENTLTEWRVYPNPANNILFIRSNESIASLRLEDMTGKLVYLKDNVAASNYTLPVSVLSEGVYLIRLKLEKGVELKTTFIKE